MNLCYENVALIIVQSVNLFAQCNPNLLLLFFALRVLGWLPAGHRSIRGRYSGGYPCGQAWPKIHEYAAQSALSPYLDINRYRVQCINAVRSSSLCRYCNRRCVRCRPHVYIRNRRDLDPRRTRLLLPTLPHRWNPPGLPPRLLP